MESIQLKITESIGERYEMMLQGIEEVYHVNLTVHDLYGRLGDPHGNPLLPGRHLHSHECCARGRLQNPQWNTQCNRDCYQLAEYNAGREMSPLLKQCWKGLWELVVPIIWHERHQMTIFAGVFRDKDAPPSQMPSWFSTTYETLPFINENKLKKLAQLLIFVGNGFLTDSEQQEIPESTGRQQLIYSFIKNRAHENISLCDLAKILFVSVSRAGHLVRESTGRSFSMLLEEERMMRARNMLLSSNQKIELIAASCGYPNPYYFNRIFSRYFGMPPGRFRSSQLSKD